MPHIVYTLNNAIYNCLPDGGTSSSRYECDASVQEIYGNVMPVSVQGLCRYTVITGPCYNKTIQFREKGSLLNLSMSKFAVDGLGETFWRRFVELTAISEAEKSLIQLAAIVLDVQSINLKKLTKL